MGARAKGTITCILSMAPNSISSRKGTEG